MRILIDEDQEITVSRLVAHLWFVCRLKAGRDRVICLSAGEAEDNRAALYVWVRKEIGACRGMNLPAARAFLEQRLQQRLVLWDQHPERRMSEGSTNPKSEQRLDMPPSRVGQFYSDLPWDEAGVGSRPTDE